MGGRTVGCTIFNCYTGRLRFGGGGDGDHLWNAVRPQASGLRVEVIGVRQTPVDDGGDDGWWGWEGGSSISIVGMNTVAGST